MHVDISLFIGMRLPVATLADYVEVCNFNKLIIQTYISACSSLNIVCFLQPSVQCYIGIFILSQMEGKIKYLIAAFKKRSLKKNVK